MSEKIVLGIETSCDETATALYCENRGLLSERVYSQWRRHAAYGGVVPELAARDHLQRLLPLLDDVLQGHERPTHIAYTKGPGLASALLTGATTAKALAYAWNLPTISVNHLEGHLLSPLLHTPTLAMPYVALLVSGGHTQLWLVIGCGRYTLLGQTLDDSVGEAFDKVAVLLGMNYPGGARLEALAMKGDASKINLPININQAHFNFSLSGLKTAVRKLIGMYSPADIAAVFQMTVTQGLARQVNLALKQTKPVGLVVVGGVARNRSVRQALLQCAKLAGINFVCPEPKHCSDNAAMIALAAIYQAKEGDLAFDIFPRQRPKTEFGGCWKI